jgi:hypothetical protein
MVPNIVGAGHCAAAHRRGRGRRDVVSSSGPPKTRTVARVEAVGPTNNVEGRTPRPVVLWRNGNFGSYSEAGSQFADRLLTVLACCATGGRPL